MRDRIYLFSFLLAAGALLYAGWGLLQESAIITWSLTFAGTTAAGVLGLTLYRVRHELRASRHELARKEAELNFAREVQQALFPREFPADGGLEFTGVCVPARGISGDYYDVMRLADRRLVFAIADISGKGISAAILMSNLHAVSRTLAKGGLSPAEICSQLNRHLHELSEGTRFSTFFYGEWNYAARCLRYINAGHNPPILVSSAGNRQLHAVAPPLGMFLDTGFQPETLVLQPGDLLVLYSDGVTEAGIDREEGFGEARLEALVEAHRDRPLPEIQQRVLAAVRRWAGEELEDDLTLLLVRAIKAGKEAP